MREAGVPTARAERFADRAAAGAYLSERATQEGAFPVVVKASGLAAGKGVVIAGDMREAERALDDFLVERRPGAGGREVPIEDYLPGRGLSVVALTAGQAPGTPAPAADY